MRTHPKIRRRRCEVGSSKEYERVRRAVVLSHCAGHCGTFCRTEDLHAVLRDADAWRVVSSGSASVNEAARRPADINDRTSQYLAAIERNDGTVVDLVLNDLTYGDVKEHREIISRLCQCVADSAATRIRARSGNET